MELFIKKFDELTADELYEIYKLRIAVFIVEQNCPYQDIDDNDKCSYHVFFKDSDGIQAYLRVIPQNTVFHDASIGRVISVKHKRRCGLGTRLVREGIKTAKEKFGAEAITIEAQVYAKKLYENVGFVQISEEFLEDNIPHIKMRLKL